VRPPENTRVRNFLSDLVRFCLEMPASKGGVVVDTHRFQQGIARQ
jgi:hypothetical protein